MTTEQRLTALMDIQAESARRVADLELFGMLKEDSSDHREYIKRVTDIFGKVLDRFEDMEKRLTALEKNQTRGLIGF
jgi:hypothetical protein